MIDDKKKYLFDDDFVMATIKAVAFGLALGVVVAGTIIIVLLVSILVGEVL